jgi:head-tail adaptor
MASVKQRVYALTQKVTVKKDIATVTDDAARDFGDRASQWVVLWEGFSHIATGMSREVWKASTTIAICTHVVRIPWDRTSSTIDETMQVTWGTKTLTITSAVDEDNLHRWMLLICNEAK